MIRLKVITSIALQTACIAALFTLAAEAAEVTPQPAPITHDQAEAMLTELKRISQLLEIGLRQTDPRTAHENPTRAVPGKVQVKIEDGYTLGAKDAPLTMIEYSDVQCPFCRRFHADAFPQIKKNYIDTGRLRFVIRDLPLEFHSSALPAAVAARCAGEQKHFWDMRDSLMANPNKLSETDMVSYARDLHLDTAAFGSCLKSGRHNAAIEKDRAEAGRLNLSGTPSFVIGKTTPEGVDGFTVVGAMPYEDFEAKFRELQQK